MPRRPARASPSDRQPRWWKALWQRVRGLVFGERILCDTCKYDYPSACRRPERPNATRCNDYARR